MVMEHSIEQYMHTIGQQARQAAKMLAAASTQQKKSSITCNFRSLGGTATADFKSQPN